MTHRSRKVFVLEYEDAPAPDGWSVLMCNTSRSTLLEHLVNLPRSTKYRVTPYVPDDAPALQAATTKKARH